MSKYVELGYPVYPGMPVYPGLPETELFLREDLLAGADWNGSVLTTYLHAGTHLDAPWHYMGGDTPKLDNTDALPAGHFVYDHPMLVNVEPQGENYLITVEDIKKAGPEIYEADALFFNTGYWKKRSADFMAYATGFPALSAEAAAWIRTDCPKVKAVAIDTLSIENIPVGQKNGFKTHRGLLDPSKPGVTVSIYEDINPEPIVGKKLKKAFCTPCRIRGDATICNIFVEIED